MRPKIIEELLHLPHALALQFTMKCGDVFIVDPSVASSRSNDADGQNNDDVTDGDDA